MTATVGVEYAAGRAIRLWRSGRYQRAVIVLRNADAPPSWIVRFVVERCGVAPEQAAAVVAAVIAQEES